MPSATTIDYRNLAGKVRALPKVPELTDQRFRATYVPDFWTYAKDVQIPETLGIKERPHVSGAPPYKRTLDGVLYSMASDDVIRELMPRIEEAVRTLSPEYQAHFNSVVRHSGIITTRDVGEDVLVDVEPAYDDLVEQRKRELVERTNIGNSGLSLVQEIMDRNPEMRWAFEQSFRSYLEHQITKELKEAERPYVSAFTLGLSASNPDYCKHPVGDSGWNIEVPNVSVHGYGIVWSDNVLADKHLHLMEDHDQELRKDDSALGTFTDRRYFPERVRWFERLAEAV